MRVPDTGNPRFREECRRQSRMLRDDDQEQELLDWIGNVADRTGWE
ncbi:antitoxin MazE-like protein [Methylomarinovum tepidoasis]